MAQEKEIWRDALQLYSRQFAQYVQYRHRSMCITLRIVRAHARSGARVTILLSKQKINC